MCRGCVKNWHILYCFALGGRALAYNKPLTINDKHYYLGKKFSALR
jgi:hypothetical protein